MRVLWSYRSPAPVRGIRLARESETLLLWDANHLVTRLSPHGAVQAQWQAPSPVAAADCADDGSSVAAVGAAGQVWFFGADLNQLWQRTITEKALTVAVAPFGEVLAVADGDGTVHLVDAAGRDLAVAANPRQFQHLLFIPERRLLIGSADFGSVAAFNLQGKRRWHDTPVAHCGSLTATGDGSLIGLASFSDGLSLYDLRGTKLTGGPRPGPCRLAALSYDGTALLTAGLDGRVRIHDRSGKPVFGYRPEAVVSSLALDALGQTAYLGQADGAVLAMATP
jgi:WD40 repeat protein